MQISGKDLVAALRRNGWVLVTVRGSHHLLKHPDRGGLVTVPVHGTETLAPRTLASILRQADATEDEVAVWL